MSETETQEVPPNEVLFSLPGAPTKEQVESWKQEHGEVFCSGFSGTELFIFRPLKRSEFVELQIMMSQSQGQLSQFEVEETTVNRCLLWASDSAKKSLTIKAGTMSTLHEQVLQNSNFVNPAMASVLVVKL